MTVRRTIRLDQVVDGAGATVLVSQGENTPPRARFSLEQLPRVEHFLSGQPVTEVPGIVEHLCGICPVSHHLAGVGALDGLRGTLQLTPTARCVRRLLHHGSVLDTHAFRFLTSQPRMAIVLRDYAQLAQTAAGAVGPFPACAVPGGVHNPADEAGCAALLAASDTALIAAQQLADAALIAPTADPTFSGPSLALVDDAGRLDLLGNRLAVVAADGTALDEATPDQWATLVAEARPGATASRPFLVALGPTGHYRVGPQAQLLVGPLSTPRARKAQARWAEQGQGVEAARAIIALHCVEVITDLARDPQSVAGPVTTPLAPGRMTPRSGTGWVDGPRGLLVHQYQVDDAGTLVQAVITTPTAQNEPWLGQMLSAAAAGLDLTGVRPDTDLPLTATVQESLELAIRTADPCLPCASAPAGRMGLRVRLDDQPAHEEG